MKNQTVKVLLDTNVLIQTEDNKRIKTTFAELSKQSKEHSIQLYLHSGTIEDIQRDTDTERKEITLSKIKKYPLLENIPCPEKNELELLYGAINKDNDYIDVQLLHALQIKAVGFLITEDNGIHTRAKKAGIENKVLFVSEAVDWFKQTYEPTPVTLPHVASMKCYEVDLSQEIFQSLKKDYPIHQID